jgi:hypothetical protein
MAPKKVTSSSDRSKRMKASKATVSGSKPSNRANRQAASTAKVTNDSGRKTPTGTKKATVTGQTIGDRVSRAGSAQGRVTQGRGAAAKSPGLIGTRNPVSAATKARMAQAAPKPAFKTTPVGPNSRLPLSKFPAKTGAKGPAAATLKSVGSQALKGAARAGLKAAARVAPGVLALNAGKVADGTLKGKPIRSAKPPSKAPSAKEKATAASFPKSFKKARSEGSKVFMWKGRKYNTKRKDGK